MMNRHQHLSIDRDFQLLREQLTQITDPFRELHPQFIRVLVDKIASIDEQLKELRYPPSIMEQLARAKDAGIIRLDPPPPSSGVLK